MTTLLSLFVSVLPSADPTGEATLAHVQELAAIQQDHTRMLIQTEAVVAPAVSTDVALFDLAIDKLRRALSLPVEDVDSRLVQFNRDYMAFLLAERSVLGKQSADIEEAFQADKAMFEQARNRLERTKAREHPNENRVILHYEALWHDFQQKHDPFLARWTDLQQTIPKTYADHSDALAELLGPPLFFPGDVEQLFAPDIRPLGRPDPNVSAAFLLAVLRPLSLRPLNAWPQLLDSSARRSAHRCRAIATRIRHHGTEGLLPSTALAARLYLTLLAFKLSFHLVPDAGFQWGRGYLAGRIPALPVERPLVIRGTRDNLGAEGELVEAINAHRKEMIWAFRIAIGDILKRAPDHRVRLAETFQRHFQEEL